MRVKFFILTFLFLFLGTSPISAASVDTPTIDQSEIQIDQSFSINSNLTNVQSGEVYFVKCRMGTSSSSLTEGQTYNPITTNWLSDTDAWIDMPIVAATNSTTSFSLQCKIKSSAAESQKIIYTRACLKKSDGTCGTSFQSSSGTTFTAIAQSSPTPTPSSTLTPTPSPTSSNSTSSFTISNIPSQINSDQSFSVTVNLSQTDNPNTKFFLKGAFRHPDKPTNYFGLTKVGSTWVKNGMNATSQLQITTDQDGNWTDKIEVQPDSLDSGFIGTGDYFFKVARYDQDGGNLTWSNEVTIKINDIGNASSNNPSPQSTPKTSPSVSTTKLQSLAQKPTPSIKNSYQIASVAGTTTSATPEGTVEVKNQKQTSPLIWIGIIFIFAGAGAIGYIYLKKNAKIHIPFGK